MPRHPLSKSELDRLMAANKDQIVLFRQQGVKVDDILEWLNDAGVQIKQAKLYQYLKAWNAQVQRPALTIEQVEGSVLPLACKTLLSDTQIARQVETRLSIDTSARQVRSARVRYRIMKHFVDPDEREAHRLETIAQVDALLRLGGGLLHGRRWAITHLRRHFGHRAHQVDVSQTMEQVNPLGVLERRLHRRWRRDDFVTSGPDFIWSLDGHDKLLRYGIQIYGAVDAYSRKIIWWYVGNSNKTQISVVRQFLRAVERYGRVPNFLRTDAGTECAMVADCQFAFYLLHGLLVEGWSDEQLLTARLNDCYIQASSTRNVRIERLWGTQGHTTTRVWIDYFAQLERPDLMLFHEGIPVDKVTIGFIFMPIIREHLSAFVETHNAHPIRKQNRRYHVPGVPDELYDNDDLRSGFSADMSLHQTWSAEVAFYDPDAYLTDDTMAWYQSQIIDLQHPEPPIISEFIGIGDNVVPEWMRVLIHRARDQEMSHVEPFLRLAPRPEGGYRKEVLDLIKVGLVEADLT
jgi:hypothetical protein